MSMKTERALMICLFILFLFEFHHLYIFDGLRFNGRRLSSLIYLGPFFLLAKGKWWKMNFLGSKLFVFYFAFAMLNIFTCYFFRGQRPEVSLAAWSTLLLVFYYLVFRTWNFSVRVWEEVVEYMFIILLILYVLKYTFMDWEFLQLDTSDEYLKKETRVRIYSDAFLELGYLYCLNKYLVFKRPKYLIMAILGFFFIFLQGFRMLIAMGVIVSLLMVLRVYKKSLSSLSIATISIISFIVLALQLPIVQNKIDELTHRNETQNFQNEDYSRLYDIQFTYSSFFIDKAEMIFGAGMTYFYDLKKPRKNVEYFSEYSRYRTRLATEFHYYPVDLGFWGLSWEAGIPFTIIAILLFLYLLKVKVPNDYYYLSLYGLYMVMSGITHAQGYYQCNLICLAVVYTIIEKANKSYKRYNYDSTHKKISQRWHVC